MDYRKALPHVGHNIVVSNYSNENIAVECEDCQEVIVDAESPKLRVCQECRSVFAPKRTNQVYCPPPAYSRGEESLCAARQRMRSYRNKLTLKKMKRNKKDKNV